MNALARRQWCNVGLLGLAAGLLALVLLEPRLKPPQTPPPVLLKMAAEQIKRIVIERPGQEGLAFEQRAGRWWMTAPTAGPVNPVLLGPILHLAEAHCPLHYASNRLDLKPLQLDPPRLRLWLDGQEIRFGATSPLDSQRYLQIGDQLYLCPDRLYPLLTSGAGSFLAPSIEALLPTPRKGG